MEGRDEKGRFIKGVSGNPECRFKKKSKQTKKEEEIHRLGGIAKRAQDEKRKTYAELCNIIGVIDASASDKENIKRLGVDPDTADQATQDFVVAAAQYMRAKAGDTRAATWIRDTKGESTINVNIEKAPIIVQDLGLDD